MRLTVLPTLAALLACAAAGSLPGWYQCTCASTPATSGTPCVCPSTTAPGNLPTASVPQFVVFTHDDSLTSTTYNAITAAMDGKKSANGCPAVATMFVTSLYTDCSLVRKLYAAGYEIADHTMTHPHMNASFTQAMVESQVLGARTKLTACGIPQADIVGFRQPFLEAHPTVRQVLSSNGFLYDSTLLEEATHSISNGMAARTWPYTLQDGIPQNCAWYGPAQNCTEDERYAGMWEVPVWVLAAKGMYSMDYGDATNSVYDVLKANFDAAYNGNRAPMPIYIHTPWLTTAHVADLKKFADYALSQTNTYFVTMRQLLAWMQNPVPAEQLTPALLGCGMPGGSGPTAAAASPSPSPSPAASPSPFPSPSPSPSPATAVSPSPAVVVASPSPAGTTNMSSMSPAPTPAADIGAEPQDASLTPIPVTPTGAAASLRATLAAGICALLALLLLV